MSSQRLQVDAWSRTEGRTRAWKPHPQLEKLQMDTRTAIILAVIGAAAILVPAIIAVLRHDPVEEQIKAILEDSQRCMEKAVRKWAARNPDLIRNGCQVRVQVLPREESDE